MTPVQVGTVFLLGSLFSVLTRDFYTHVFYIIQISHQLCRWNTVKVKQGTCKACVALPSMSRCRDMFPRISTATCDSATATFAAWLQANMLYFHPKRRRHQAQNSAS